MQVWRSTHQEASRPETPNQTPRSLLERREWPQCAVTWRLRAWTLCAREWVSTWRSGCTSQAALLQTPGGHLPHIGSQYVYGTERWRTCAHERGRHAGGGKLQLQHGDEHHHHRPVHQGRRWRRRRPPPHRVAAHPYSGAGVGVRHLCRVSAPVCTSRCCALRPACGPPRCGSADAPAPRLMRKPHARKRPCGRCRADAGGVCGAGAACSIRYARVPLRPYDSHVKGASWLTAAAGDGATQVLHGPQVPAPGEVHARGGAGHARVAAPRGDIRTSTVAAPPEPHAAAGQGGWLAREGESQRPYTAPVLGSCLVVFDDGLRLSLGGGSRTYAGFCAATRGDGRWVMTLRPTLQPACATSQCQLSEHSAATVTSLPRKSASLPSFSQALDRAGELVHRKALTKPAFPPSVCEYATRRPAHRVHRLRWLRAVLHRQRPRRPPSASPSLAASALLKEPLH